MLETKLGVMGGGGHIGLIHGACLASLGYHVVACDRDTLKIKNLKKGITPIYEPGLEEMVLQGLAGGRLKFTSRIAPLCDAEIVYICVGTPPLPSGMADTEQVKKAVAELAQAASGPVIMVIKSTVPVGTNRKLSEQIAKMGLPHKATIISSPEFLGEGSGINDFLKPSRIVIGGEDQWAVERIAAIQNPSTAPVILTTWENAELIKHASNAFLATKISFINEMASLSEALKGDIRIVSKGIGLDPRIGPLFLEAGVGFSGPCLEKDLLSLINQFINVGEEAALLKTVLNVNRYRRRNLVQKLEGFLGNLKGKKIGVLGLAFKPGTDDIRDSHSIPIIRHLLDLGAMVTVHDPQVGEGPKKTWLGELFPELLWASSPYNAAEGKDGLLILTAWPEYRELDLQMLKHSLANPIMVDGRNLFEPSAMKNLGIKYVGVGI